MRTVADAITGATMNAPVVQARRSGKALMMAPQLALVAASRFRFQTAPTCGSTTRVCHAWRLVCVPAAQRTRSAPRLLWHESGRLICGQGQDCKSPFGRRSRDAPMAKSNPTSASSARRSSLAQASSPRLRVRCVSPVNAVQGT